MQFNEVKQDCLHFKGNIPCKCKKDIIFFKNKTKNNIVIMGRNTYFSLLKPLQNRLNIVLTKHTEIYTD